MSNPKHIVIFSHGFGTRKDDRGLFTAIEKSLENIECVLFDYYEINDTENTLTARPLEEQAKMLEEVLLRTREANPEAVIDLVCHSQGSITASLLKPKGIRKTIFITPPFNIDVQRTFNAFKNRPGTEINMSGVSKFARKDGSMTLIPANFWKDRSMSEIVGLFNEVSKETELTIIRAKQDEVLPGEEVVGLNESIKLVDLEGGHNFDGEYRDGLIKEVRSLII